MNLGNDRLRPAGLLLAALLLAIAASAAYAAPKASPFKAQDIEGRAVSFPSDYKGRVVMLDFWATWCPPCIAEVPGIVAAYNKHHAAGFDILGISLDQANSLDRVRAFMKNYGMTWPQVYDGKYWQARIAQFYRIDSIPRAFLVDGDSGEILASGDSLRGSSLESAVARAIDSKSK